MRLESSPSLLHPPRGCGGLRTHAAHSMPAGALPASQAVSEATFGKCNVQVVPSPYLPSYRRSAGCRSSPLCQLTGIQSHPGVGSARERVKVSAHPAAPRLPRALHAHLRVRGGDAQGEAHARLARAPQGAGSLPDQPRRPPAGRQVFASGAPTPTTRAHSTPPQPPYLTFPQSALSYPTPLHPTPRRRAPYNPNLKYHTISGAHGAAEATAS